MKKLLLVGAVLTAIQVSALSKEQRQSTSAPVSTNQVAQSLSPVEKTALLRQVEIAQTAFNHGDFDTMMRLMHPAVFKLAGGKDAFEKAARAAMDQIKQMGVKYLKTEFGEPSAPYPAGKEIICFVPRTSLIQFPDKTIKSKAYWVAIRPVDGSEWKFIDGAGIEHNRESLWMMFPELQRDIKFPEWKQEPAN
jgi:hypothetical protein